MELEPVEIILRERAPDSKGEPTGWLVLVAGRSGPRELLAILRCEIGLEVARGFARMLAAKYRLPRVTEELSNVKVGELNLISEVPYSSHYQQV